MKERNLKEKAKKFWEENKNTIIMSGINGAIATGIGIYYHKKGYKAGLVDGTMHGFNKTLKWLDEHFPEESNAVELWNRYKELHQDKVVYRKGIGKWS